MENGVTFFSVCLSREAKWPNTAHKPPLLKRKVDQHRIGRWLLNLGDDSCRNLLCYVCDLWKMYRSLTCIIFRNLLRDICPKSTCLLCDRTAANVSMIFFLSDSPPKGPPSFFPCTPESINSKPDNNKVGQKSLERSFGGFFLAWILGDCSTIHPCVQLFFFKRTLAYAH